MKMEYEEDGDVDDPSGFLDLASPGQLLIDAGDAEGVRVHTHQQNVEG